MLQAGLCSGVTAGRCGDSAKGLVHQTDTEPCFVRCRIPARSCRLNWSCHGMACSGYKPEHGICVKYQIALFMRGFRAMWPPCPLGVACGAAVDEDGNACRSHGQNMCFFVLHIQPCFCIHQKNSTGFCQPGQPLLFFTRRISSNIKHDAPMVMATSAILKAGKCPP